MAITVQNVVIDPDGNPLANTQIRITLAASTSQPPAPGHTATQSILSTWTTLTDNSGAWSATLTPNSQISPAGSYYQVLEGGYLSTIVAPASGGPYNLAQLLVTPPTLAPPGITGVQTAANGVVAGVRPGLNVISGAGILVTAADDPGTGAVNVTITNTGGGGGGTPSGTVVSETAYGQSAAAGAATAYSRGDHTHGTVPLPTPAQVGSPALSVVTTKGDLYVATASGVVARLGVGSDTQVLTADSAQSTGVKWAAAAGGGTDFKVAVYPLTGRWYRAPSFGSVGANLTMTLNRCYYAPFRVGASGSYQAIGCEVATAGSAGAVVRLGIFASDAAGSMPGTLILDAGTVTADTGGGKQITGLSQALSAGVYWLAACNQVAGGGVLLRAGTSYDPLIPYSSSATNTVLGSTAPGGMYANSISGAFASNPSIVDNDNGPIIALRAA